MNITKTIEALKYSGYTVSYFESTKEATEHINQAVDGETVGFGDSISLWQMGLFERLAAHNHVIDPQHCPTGMSFLDTAQRCLTTDVFLTSVNAAAETGELVNIDGTGNRVAGSLFGHEKVYFVVGTNKLVPTFEDAVWRARNVAAPKNAMRLGLKTPCAAQGDRCYDCSSPQRICNGMVIHFKKMNDIEMEVVLVNQSLGL